MKNALQITFLTILISFPAQAIVKLSSSGICHDESSSSYNRTRNFKPYPTIKDCLNSGGRLPKGKSASTNSAGKEYERKYFGHGWDDSDGDCQNTRHEILIAQNVGNLAYTDSKKCAVKSGKWNSLFTGKTHYSAKDLDIDHIVPLKFAWDHGADKWTNEKRERFANVSANLVAVESSLNRQKGAKDITEWLPPTNQCQYITRFVRLVKEYKLKLSATEKKKFDAVKVKHCGK